jgi:hypothetical protein
MKSDKSDEIFAMQRLIKQGGHENSSRPFCFFGGIFLSQKQAKINI